AIHPGYGFLSENADFAERVEQSGFVFIGPPAGTIRLMGDKVSAKNAMKKAGVPVVPGTEQPVTDDAEAARVATQVGYPVMLKAAMGGGGKGMRLVRAPGELASALRAARAEAGAAFGDAAVYVERYVEEPRHIEIQVLADAHGGVVHLGERECSIQRRHQKLVEESPSPFVTPELRRRMGEAACRVAAAVGYVNAGTVEFLVDRDRNFYFLEMNTRLQVEHPVTEMIYGLDLVSWQLDVAEGKPLPMTQQELDASRHGHAVECRIYAEDPVKFLPSPGKISHLRVPDGPYVRNDSGCYEGAEIPVHYDPMISKLVVWGEDRARAIARMRRALDEYQVRGIETNLAFHRRCLRQAAFIAGDYDTGFIGRNAAELAPHADETELTAAIIAAVLDVHTHSPAATPAGVPTSIAASNGAEISGWRRQLM
ncbi:MAG TPA: biotin carboxylase N-terminal domain-containing protein, partial [Kofleriaceae bacterium]|nr:biotin carboxylase N-terminal domain-containing protein [Kofleriaceae bacterium]